MKNTIVISFLLPTLHMKLCCTSKIRMLGVLSLGALLVTMLHSTVVQLPAETVSAAFAECADGIDNDNNGKIDYPQDPKCQSLQDDSEGDPVQAVFISLSDGLAIVTPNGHMTYTIGLRTERSSPVITDVYFQMPHQTSLISASDGGYRSDELIVWKNVSINPGSLRSLYVNINVSPDAEVDTLLVAEARADGDRTG